MPVKRKVGLLRHTLDPFASEHLQTGGDHLLANDVCWVCEHGIESARSVWEASRDEILADWNRVGFPYPCLAQVVFDGEPFPPAPDRAWRDLYRWTWGMIADELRELGRDVDGRNGSRVK